MDHPHTQNPIKLGLCCLNTILRNPKKLPNTKKKPDPIFSSRSMIFKTLLEQGFVEAITRSRQNLTDIIPMLEWNLAHKIYVFRLSSEIFPHISNPDIYKKVPVGTWDGSPMDAARYQSLDWCQDLLEKVGAFARENGIRLTFHPGQFNVLGTSNKETLDKTRTELEIHARILDMMGMGPDSIMVIHGGGIYMTAEQRKMETNGRIEAKYGVYPVPSIEATTGVIKRWVDNFLTMPENVQRRLVLENCEKSYSLEDCLRVSDLLHHRTGKRIPIVYDTHHYACYSLLHPDETQTPVDQLIGRVLNSWISRGIKPKFHISEQGKGKCGHHSDFVETITPELLGIHSRYKYRDTEMIDTEQVPVMDKTVQTWKPVCIDIMIEAKAKEGAILHLYQKPEYRLPLAL